MRGVALAAVYAAQVVGPLLDRAVPGVPIALARLGSGSDVLGLDDAVSRDHDWGLRLTVLVPDAEIDRVDAALERGLPAEFRGLPTRFGTTWQPEVRQRAEVTSPRAFALFRTGLDLSREPTTQEWLSLTGQSALEFVAGPVFRDDDGETTRARARLTGYPEDVRRFAIASAWTAIGQELPFVGRTAQRGDDPGSRMLAARIVRRAMHLGFLVERRWAPYSKWLGTAFTALPTVGRLAAPARRALAAQNAHDREAALVTVLDGLARAQGESGLPTLFPVTQPFFDRPFVGLRDGLPEAVLDAIGDPALRALRPAGVPEQWSDDVGVLVDAETRMAMTRALYPSLA